MNLLDLLLIAAAVAFAVSGYRQGFVTGLLSFIGIVNEYVIASVILVDTEKQTLVVGMFKLVSNPRYADWSAFSAGAVMAAIPVVVLFLLLQRYIVGGLTAGATKG